MKIIALKNKVLVTDIEGGATVTQKGIIIPDDDMKERGIRPRWAKVYAVGTDVLDLRPGQWILISHGRWSRAIDVADGNKKISVRQVDYPDAILLVSDSAP